ncbi:PREDICTED: olfactory receptor 4K14 [Ceratotherium simum simum]|uniref:Olfactory receptor n=1 Tax=Ceratotherium simum simum TaxID=73337 RepID=A0ABM1CAC2_CERSS|nr:PREDICTED: olfactory receptor 4K14 [Ceratotherium simum simum]XP_014636504.1 PREDICTED: olfactory receptor 4K14 [Ceratotherium simum simum]
MDLQNYSLVSEFVLHGLCTTRHLQNFFFIFFSGIYVATVLGNLIIVVTVIFDPCLHSSPVYFLLGNLSFLDVWLASFATPKMIRDFLSDRKLISFGGCMAQIFFLHFIGGAEMVLLVSMAYDRYVAICKPLHYMTMMSRQTCIGLVLVSWVIGFVHSISQVAFTVNLPYCGPNEVDSFFCDLPLVIKLACMDTYVLGILMISDSGFLSMICFLLLLISYTVILITVRQHAAGGVSKALSTCSAHIMVVTLFFGPCIFIYVWPFSRFSMDKLLSVFYTIFTPLLNPLIYTLRNKEMKIAMKKLWNQHVTFH